MRGGSSPGNMERRKKENKNNAREAKTEEGKTKHGLLFSIPASMLFLTFPLLALISSLPSLLSLHFYLCLFLPSLCFFSSPQILLYFTRCSSSFPSLTLILPCLSFPHLHILASLFLIVSFYSYFFSLLPLPLTFPFLL